LTILEPEVIETIPDTSGGPGLNTDSTEQGSIDGPSGGFGGPDPAKVEITYDYYEYGNYEYTYDETSSSYSYYYDYYEEVAEEQAEEDEETEAETIGPVIPAGNQGS